MVTFAPVAVMGRPSPASEAATGRVSWTAEEAAVVVAETVRLTVATTPSVMVLVLIPVSRQITDPTLGAQVVLLPAAVAAGPSRI